jgi:hypothetical protein
MFPGSWLTFPGDILSDRDTARNAELCAAGFTPESLPQRPVIHGLALSVVENSGGPPFTHFRVEASVHNIAYGVAAIRDVLRCVSVAAGCCVER